MQGRYVGNNKNAIRYITIKNKESTRLWYGLNRVRNEPVFVVEGPIDSLFLPNGVATLGMDATLTLPNSISDKKVVFVIDNEPRNHNVVQIIQQLIQKKFNVVIWPNTVKEKDINDMVLSGKTTNQIVDIINQNTYNGLQAQLKLNEWKKI